jgi:putative restriction endonuclease
MSRFWLGVTDIRWLEYLKERQLDEVNFWQPGGQARFRAINPGDLFLFKLKSPVNRIAGGAFFLKYSRLPLSLAWEAFQEKNGANTLTEMRNMILSLRRDSAERDPSIGCIILINPFFFPETAWIEAPADWSRNLVRGKTYSTETRQGQIIFDAIMERLAATKNMLGVANAIEEEKARYGAGFLARARLGQGAFRIVVTDAYERRCAITGEKTLPVLEAAHIKPFAESGPNALGNGLLLRSDFHILFDKGYVTVSPDFEVVVSRRIKEEWFNGKAYYSLHGKQLANLPKEHSSRPLGAFLEWHNSHVFKE